MVNPAGLDLKIPSPDFFDDYEVSGVFTPPPPAKFVNDKGKAQYVTYVATLPGIDKIEIGATKDGYLKAVIKDIVLEGGYVITQTHVGSNQYVKRDKAGNAVGTRNSSPLGDLFRSAGLDMAQYRPSTVDQYQELLNGIAGRQVQVTIDWQSYDSDSASTVAANYEAFPIEDEKTGARQPFVVLNGKNFWARASVKRWISAV